MQTERNDAFIVYASADAAKAEKLARTLEQQGRTAWTDRKSKPGEDWVQESEAVLTASRAIVLLLPPRNLNSARANFETGLALAQNAEERTPVVPILLESLVFEQLPSQLKRIPALDGAGQDADAIAEQIDRALEQAA